MCEKERGRESFHLAPPHLKGRPGWTIANLTLCFIIAFCLVCDLITTHKRCFKHWLSLAQSILASHHKLRSKIHRVNAVRLETCCSTSTEGIRMWGKNMKCSQKNKTFKPTLCFSSQRCYRITQFPPRRANCLCTHEPYAWNDWIWTTVA